MKRFALGGVLTTLVFGSVILAQDKALKELEGTYKPTSIVKDGEEAKTDFRENVSVKITGGELVFVIKDKSYPAKIKLDSTKKPSHIDISPTDGPEKGKTFLGIYKIEKGELVMAFVEKGLRPTEFKGEGPAVLFRLKRESKKDKKPISRVGNH